MSAESEQSPLVWQTILHVLCALTLLIPAIYVVGLFAYLYDILLQGYIGRSGEGIGFIMRGVQYFLAGYASLFLPTILLRRSNLIIVCTIFGTTVAIICALGLIISILNPEYGNKYGFYEWLTIISSFIGLIASAFMYNEMST